MKRSLALMLLILSLFGSAWAQTGEVEIYRGKDFPDQKVLSATLYYFQGYTLRKVIGKRQTEPGEYEVFLQAYNRRRRSDSPWKRALVKSLDSGGWVISLDEEVWFPVIVNYRR